MKIIKKVDDFRVVEFPAIFPGCPADTFYEIQYGRHLWIDNQVKVIWEILRVIIHENKKYAKETALSIFNVLTQTY